MKCYIVIYDYYDEDYNTSEYKILGVYNSFEKAQAKMHDQAQIIEHNNTFDGELSFDHKEIARHYAYFYNDENSTQENIIIHETTLDQEATVIKVNNKNGIEMFYEFANDVDKINILDSMGNYFNDLYIETNEDGSYNGEDVDAVIKMLEETNLQEMGNFFNATVCKDIKELADAGTDYINIFRVNGKACFVVSE